MFIYTGVLVLNSLSVEIKGRLSTLSTGRVHMGDLFPTFRETESRIKAFLLQQPLLT